MSKIQEVKVSFLRIHIIPMIQFPENLIELDDLLIFLKEQEADQIHILYVNNDVNRERVFSTLNYINNYIQISSIIHLTPINNTNEALTEEIIKIAYSYTKPQLFLNLQYWDTRLVTIATILRQYFPFECYYINPSNSLFIPLIPSIPPSLDVFTTLLLHVIITYYQNDKKILMKSDCKAVLKQNPELDTYSKSAFNNYFSKSWFLLKKYHYILEKDINTPIELTNEGKFADSLYYTLRKCRSDNHADFVNFMMNATDRIELEDGIHITVSPNSHIYINANDKIYTIQNGFTRENNFQFEPLTK